MLIDRCYDLHHALFQYQDTTAACVQGQQQATATQQQISCMTNMPRSAQASASQHRHSNGTSTDPAGRRRTATSSKVPENEMSTNGFEMEHHHHWT